MSNDIHKCIHKCINKQAGTPLMSSTRHASVTSLRAISESEGTESFVLAPAKNSGVRCLATRHFRNILSPPHLKPDATERILAVDLVASGSNAFLSRFAAWVSEQEKEHGCLRGPLSRIKW
ncbi:hypothetical protein B0H13DRAFT_1864660 [Mycena leptocephala]|nr:hypothetical protein B0H13DRAFT_1864660 [Mycena leptocephala]